jgi:hypothetical protein
MVHWSWNDEGKPQPFGGVVLDLVRMTLYDLNLAGTSNAATAGGRGTPDPEVIGRAVRRRFTAAHKQRILAEVEGGLPAPEPSVASSAAKGCTLPN